MHDWDVFHQIPYGIISYNEMTLFIPLDNKIIVSVVLRQHVNVTYNNNNNINMERKFA